MTRCFICGSTECCDHREDTLHFPQPIHREPAADSPKPIEAAPAKKTPRLQTARHRARYYLSRAVRCGEIRKPLQCERCGITPKRLEAHHWDYTKPLAVTWLCKMCHGFVDKLIGSMRGEPVQIFRNLDLDRIATLLRTEFQTFGYDEVPMSQRLGRFSEFPTGTATTGLKRGSDGSIQ